MADDIVFDYKARNGLYPDFTLTDDNCASEPIHRPIAIQGHGHLLVFDTSDDPTLTAISNNLAPCLGQKTEALWTLRLADWLPDPIMKIVDMATSSNCYPQILQQALKLANKSFQIAHHTHEGKLIVEFEPDADTQVDDTVILEALHVFRNISNVETLYSEATRLIAEAFGYDRVMIYQFDDDQHGCVVGEHKIDALEPLLGLHYPETDIPKIARDLFLLVKSRSISDVNAHYDILHFNPKLGSNPPYLDLSYSQIRATSPIHVKYLQNMGVTATLTLAIIIQGKLWGLVACHHHSARQVCFHHRLIGEVITDLLAKRIFEIEFEKQRIIESTSRKVEKSLLEQVIMHDNYRIAILEHASSISSLCEADGAALITQEQCIYRAGIAPSDTTLLTIQNWLVKQGHDEVFSTNNFSEVINIPLDNEQLIGGIMSSCISTVSHSFLIWFRHPITQTVDWAGDPENSYTIEHSNNDGDVQLNPRKSFEKWQVKVEGQSKRWENSALEMADRVRQGIFKKELRHTAMLVEKNNKEFMWLTFAAAHDLQEPLRTQSSYLELLRDSLASKDYDSVPHCLNRTEIAVDRMKNLVTDLLDYSQLGMVNVRETVCLSEAVEDVRVELEASLNETHAQLTVGKLPTIIGDSKKLRQLIRNLLTNAIKYVDPGTKPEISVFMEQESSFWTLNVKDNGIGIAPEFHSKIYGMFKRLHGKAEYEGSGVGLAICAKVAESMSAEIGVNSALGEGSTFWIRFHNSTIV